MSDNPADEGQLFPRKSGERLRAERERQGLTVTEIAARTRVPQRHLEALEENAFDRLPSPTYAVGFARAYARAVGADDVAIAQQVRSEVAEGGRRQPEYVPYTTADPARAPSRGVIIVAAGVALALLILAVLWFSTTWFQSGSTGTPVASAPVPQEAAQRPAAPAPSATPTPVSSGQVRLTATDAVWLRVYDAANTTLFMGTMKPGEFFDVPANANDPKINVGRADKLQVTLNGSVVPALGTGERPIKDVSVSSSAIAARLNGAPAAAATPAATPSPSASPTPAPSPSASASPRPKPSPSASSSPKKKRKPLTDVQRANLSSAAAMENGTSPPVP